jgi:glycosyltransferase involved in cell wall biosynthesis
MIPRVTIAIPDLAGPHARAATMAALERHTPDSNEIILLAEQPIAAYSGQTLAVSAPFSMPFALNRLLAATTTPYLLLIESGAIVTAGWLARLLAALDDPAVGLSGPSTNWCWNEQGLLPRGAGPGWTVERIDAYAAEVAARHGDAMRPLDTLHSLADFCYVFKRELAVALGGFDESYGAGPCWEIDFNTRAARAGFRSVWVMGAYVHRAPPSAWRTQSERRLFTPNKHRYQDRFCGLRLRGEKTTYEAHCRGEACEHFAPTDRIQIRLTLTDDDRPTTTDYRPATICDDVSLSPTPNSHSPTPIPHSPSPNLVSCIMPTRNRADFVLQSITYFQRQTYANRELIIVDDGTDDLAQRLPADPRIRYLRVTAGMSIGAKRNLACEQAHGVIIAQWDDDDWYAPARLEQQIAPLLAGTAAITGLITGTIFDLPRWEFWRCNNALHRRLFCEDVHGGTLVYRRDVWARHARYPDCSLAEDAQFLRQAIRRGMRLFRIPGEALFVYLRHASNSWAFQCGQYIDPSGWQRIPAPLLPPADCAFYAAHSPAAPTDDEQNQKSRTENRRTEEPENRRTENLRTPNSQLPTPNSPLISCIMPTSNRRAFVPRAISYFLRQDYASKELIVLDDGDDPVADLIQDDPRIRYVRLERRIVLGAKRNHCVELAHGDLIMHWDDDDWHAPQRLSLQYAALCAAGAEICGLRQMLFYEPAARAAWLYSYPPRARPWLAGGSLFYTRALWQRAPFPNVHVGEDTRFVWEHNIAHAAIVDDYRWYVARIHPANTSPKQRAGACWRPWPGDLPSILGPDYDAFCRVQDKDGKLIDRALVEQ